MPLPSAGPDDSLEDQPTASGDVATGGPVLGLLIDCTDDSYQNQLLLALAAAARRRGASLLCFSGGPPASNTVRSRVYDLAGSEIIDALIVSAGTLESGVGQEQLLAFCKRFVGVPAVSIGLAVSGIPSVLLDNGQGTHSAVQHLIKEHGCQRLAFIGGPPSNDEARARSAGYREALLGAGLEYDPQLEVCGDFLFESGRAAVRSLLDDRRVVFDALVAANDDMALGALTELQRRGYRIPSDIAVVGFDDSRAGSCVNPPLTSLRQPLQDQAEAAVDLALRQLDGGALPSNVQLKAQLVRRRSCGCSLEHRDFAVEPPRHPRKSDEESPLLHKSAELVREVLEAGGALINAAGAEALVSAFIAELMGKPEHPLMAAWEAILSRAAEADLDPSGLQSVVTALRIGAVPSLVGLGGVLTRAETMLHESRVLLAHASQQQALRERLRQQRAWHVLSDLAQSLITCSKQDELQACFARAVAGLLVPSCFLSLEPASAKRKKVPRRPLEHLTRVFPSPTGSKSVRLALRSGQPSDPREQLGLGQPRAFVVEPLFHGSHWYGILILELGPADGSVYEALRSQLSAGIHTLAVAEEETRATDMHRQLSQRALAHSEMLGQVVRGLQQAGSATSASDLEPDTALRSALDALIGLAREWSNVAGRERDTERAPSARS